jgi:hypothetical protein
MPALSANLKILPQKSPLCSRGNSLFSQALFQKDAQISKHLWFNCGFQDIVSEKIGILSV